MEANPLHRCWALSGGLLTPLQNFLQTGFGFDEELVGSRWGNAKLPGDFDFRVAVGKQEKASLLLGGQAREGGFQIELRNELLLLLVGKALPNLKLGRAEGLGSLLDLLEVEIANVFSLAQRRIPRWDPDRLALHHNTNGGPHPNGFEPPLLRPLRMGL